ncbi:MAG TPA: hypothetical protein VL501_08405 [Pyrinomonadaceae bacterium]|nr:hypothetical protein [Pyrinomonadaceae bacterium]
MAPKWSIHNNKGELLGESQAMSAKVAFILFMSAKGKSLSLRDVHSEPLPDGRTRLEHGGRVHFLKKEPKSSTQV